MLAFTGLKMNGACMEGGDLLAMPGEADIDFEPPRLREPISWAPDLD